MNALALLPLAFALGALHAFDADHLAAVSAFAARHRSAPRAMGLGLRWALGHGAMLGLLTSALWLFQLQITSAVESGLEMAVGAAMLALGGWVFWTLRRHKIHAHIHEHDGYRHLHFHSHARDPEHRHQHSATLLGGLHGAAGTAAVLALIPAAASKSLGMALLFVTAFGMGVMAAMTFYAFLIGRYCEWTLRRSTRLYFASRAAAGLASCAIGVWWLAKNL